ncbi:unnamed protein product [Lymnaea stagnalis]|uniref:Uncharacterized protein n=1 Tax=Lymnaea stagnalis TaxID=6523 RepID=A0AAV2HLE9_LYMST
MRTQKTVPGLCLVMMTLTLLFELSAGSKFLLTVPKEPYYDANLTATVTPLVLTQQSETVHLSYRGSIDKSKELNSTTLTFHSYEAQTWVVVFPWERMQELHETGVVLFMTSNSVEEKITLKFRQSSGYIFIQTDKPIYTPRQTVKFRVIAVDEYQKLSKYHLKVDIRNSQNVTVDRLRYSADEAFKSQDFELPKDTPPGIWHIFANFEGLDNSFSAAYNVSFEVREYVLPRFSGKFQIDTDVISRETPWLTLNVTAKYVYGQPVLGTAEIQLGVWSQDKGIRPIPGAVYSGKLTNGFFKTHVKVVTLFPRSEPFPQNHRLYVKVVVTESATQETFTIEDTSTFITHPYYIVDFKPSKQHFKPGFPYLLQINIHAQSGHPASWVELGLKPKYFNDNGVPLEDIQTRHIHLKLDASGVVVREFNMPINAYRVEFQVVIVDFQRMGDNEFKFNTLRFPSPRNEYIHISLPTPVTKRKDGIILLRYTAPTGPVKDKITITILSKGHVIFTAKNINRNADGRTTVHLPYRLYPEVTPSMRIVAFYSTLDSEVVIDSLFVNTPDYCYEELGLFKAGGLSNAPLRPKDTFNMHVSGGPSMRVGFVAVDKSVYLLNDKQTLNRQVLFRQLDSHDQGKDGGDGQDYKTILENSGLHHMVVDNKEIPMEGRLDEPLFSHVVGLEGKSMNTNGFSPMLDEDLPTYAQPQTVRNYFPESWLFEEQVLTRAGNLNLNLTLPDSITTWSFMAVGLSANRGVCVSQPLEQQVMKLFFADVRMPYKVTRLEEVKVKIAVYNYQQQALVVTGVVTGDDSLCISGSSSREINNLNNQKNVTFHMSIPSGQAATETVKVIPLQNGELTLRVDLQSQNDRDVVEKKLFVIAEGQRVRKTITFVLDPEGKHANFAAKKGHDVYLSKSVTIQNMIDLQNKQQHTRIDMALPKELIKGTEFCRISAFGDLMGDIITHAVVRSKSLIDQPLLNAEEVLGDLGPTVHALLYVNQTGLMDDELREKGRRFVRHGVSRLLKYKKEKAFILTPDAKEATWLTTLVLKTLCHSSLLTFIDKENLIDEGFLWLQSQTNVMGVIKEQDWRLAQDSAEYRIMLSAEVLIALKECDRTQKLDHQNLIGLLGIYLEDSLENITLPLVLAKAAYALKLFDAEGDVFQTAKDRLNQAKLRDKIGHFYWADTKELDYRNKVPYWYREGAQASSIEATSYALLVFLDNEEVNVDAIADWLISQRNQNGAFIGALDSTVAIQALTKYGLMKHELDGLTVNLNCNISSDRARHYSRFIKFTEENAMRPESLNNVPVGKLLEVVTEGQGLGQMQVNVEYNIPLEKNKNCMFNAKVEVKLTQISIGNDLCSSCSIGCPETSKSTRDAHEYPSNYIHPASRSSNKNLLRTDSHDYVSFANIFMCSMMSPALGWCTTLYKTTNNNNSKFVTLSTSEYVASKRSICVHVCVGHLGNGDSHPINLRVDMLTGYQPLTSDLDLIRKLPDVHHVEYLGDTEALLIQFLKIKKGADTCFGFRAVDEEEVGRHLPALIVITEVGRSEPSCILEYLPPPGQESLKVYCAEFSNSNRGECKCFSGLCSSCRPYTRNDLDLHNTKKLACNSPIAYQLAWTSVTDQIQWMQINANILAINKTGADPVRVGSSIQMISPSSCDCLIRNFEQQEKLYMLSSDVERLVDKNGQYVNRYLLDQNSVFLRVTEPGEQPSSTSSTSPAVLFSYLQEAFNPTNTCEA